MGNAGHVAGVTGNGFRFPRRSARYRTDTGMAFVPAFGTGMRGTRLAGIALSRPGRAQAPASAIRVRGSFFARDPEHFGDCRQVGLTASP